MSSILLESNKLEQQKSIISDYLHHAFIAIEPKIQVYDPVLALSLNLRTSIPKKFLDLAAMEPARRKVTTINGG